MIKHISTTLIILTALVSVTSAQKVKKQTIEAVEGLQFNPVRFSMKRNEQLQLNFINQDPNDQPHNIVIIEPGALKQIQAASLKVDAAAIANNYIPKVKTVLAASKLVEAGKKETITFKPEKKGVYHFICTYPGHAQIMYGAIYVDQRPPRDLVSDPNIPDYIRNLERDKLKKSLAVERPTVMRAFLPEAGPAAIAVALPGDLNFCWDAGNCRLRYTWSGAFVDPRAMLNSNGSKFTEILGTKFWSSGGDENTFTIQTKHSKARPDFKGYRLIDGIPEFNYTLDDLDVRERIISKEGSLHWNLQIKGASTPVRLFAPGQIEATSGKRDGDFIVLDAKAAQNFTLKITPSK